MNPTITFLCLLFIVFTTEVKAAPAPVNIVGTPILLNNQDGVSGQLAATEVSVNFMEYSLLKNPILWGRGDRTLIVHWGRDRYSFHIPKASIDTNGEFNVDRNNSSQPARISSRIFKSAEIKTINNKVIACESPLSSHHTDFPARTSTRYNLPKMIEVQVETTSWEQQSVYFIISSAVDYTVLKEQPERKSREKIIGSLAECYSN